MVVPCCKYEIWTRRKGIWNILLPANPLQTAKIKVHNSINPQHHVTMCKCDRVSIASIFRTTGIQNLFTQFDKKTCFVEGERGKQSENRISKMNELKTLRTRLEANKDGNHRSEGNTCSISDIQSVTGHCDEGLGFSLPQGWTAPPAQNQKGFMVPYKNYMPMAVANWNH